MRHIVLENVSNKAPTNSKTRTNCCDPSNPPILTGKPGGRRKVMKSRSFAKWALEMAIRSMMGVTCSARDRGWLSLSHSVALNLERR